MTRALVSLIGSDVRFSGHGLDETCAPVEQAAVLLRGWSERYDRASARDDEGELLAIGREMFARLCDAGFGAGGAGDREFKIAIGGGAEPSVAAARLDAPWELLATNRGPLAADDLQPFVTWRWAGPEGAPAAPVFRDLRLMFMAAALEGQMELDFKPRRRRSSRRRGAATGCNWWSRRRGRWSSSVDGSPRRKGRSRRCTCPATAISTGTGAWYCFWKRRRAARRGRRQGP